MLTALLSVLGLAPQQTDHLDSPNRAERELALDLTRRTADDALERAEREAEDLVRQARITRDRAVREAEERAAAARAAAGAKLAADAREQLGAAYREWALADRPVRLAAAFLDAWRALSARAEAELGRPVDAAFLALVILEEAFPDRASFAGMELQPIGFHADLHIAPAVHALEKASGPHGFGLALSTLEATLEALSPNDDARATARIGAALGATNDVDRARALRAFEEATDAERERLAAEAHERTRDDWKRNAKPRDPEDGSVIRRDDGSIRLRYTVSANRA